MATSLKPAATYTNNYVMDLETYRHLVRWGLRFGPWATENAFTNIDAIVKHLESLPKAEAESWINEGWTRVANLVSQHNDGMPF